MASRKKNNKSRRHIEAMFTSSSSEDEAEVTMGCRSCRNTSKEHFSRPRIDTDHLKAGQESLRREVNSFSFKHFLKNGAQPNYQSSGARPKVYSPPTSCPNHLEKDTAVYSCNPTELPDFVQDHLVIEQCYLNHESNQPTMPDMDNLPDFALNSMEQRQARLRNDPKTDVTSVSCDLPFDSNSGLDKAALHRDYSLPINPQKSTEFDLPSFDRSNVKSSKRPKSSGFPLDLPEPLDESDLNSNNSVRVSSVTGESGVPKSLPDFLNDGPIHNRTAVSTDSGTSSNVSETTDRRLLAELERLRHELESARKLLIEKNKRIQLLESELASRKEADRDKTLMPDKNVMYDNENVKHNNERGASGESAVSTLKKEIKSLTTEISLLRVENKKLRNEVATADGAEYSSPSNVNRTVRRLAGDLRNAASSAELSLRQLMSGVDNLRVLASTLENVDRIEDRTKDFLPDFDEDNAAGPAT